MRAIGRVFAFGIGLALGAFLLIALSHLNRGFWLPAALSMVLTAVLYTAPWVRSRGLAGIVSLALGSGVMWGWLATADSTRRRFDFTYLPTALAGILMLATSIGALGVALYIPAKQRGPAWRLIIPVAMVWLVALSSSSAGGASPMTTWLTTRFGLSLHDAEIVVIAFRKSVHFVFYGLLALSARSAAHAAKEPAASSFRFGLSFALAVAAFDELRQLTSPGRTGSGWDVLLDMAGALFFLGLAHRRTKPKPKGQPKSAASSTKAKS